MAGEPNSRLGAQVFNRQLSTINREPPIAGRGICLPRQGKVCPWHLVLRDLSPQNIE